jgi:hypothetical protein
MKELDAKYDPTQSNFTPIVAGFYPAHVSGYSTREVKTKVGDAIVINLTYTIAEEAGAKEQLMYQMDGYEHVLDSKGNKKVVKDEDGKSKFVKCTHIVGKKFRDNGTFVFTGEEGVGRNGRYYALLNNFGVNLKADSDGNFPLSLLEESDVVGKPILAKLDSETYEKDGEERTAWKVSNVQPWSDGQQLSVEELDEDLPF